MMNENITVLGSPHHDLGWQFVGYLGREYFPLVPWGWEVVFFVRAKEHLLFGNLDELKDDLANNILNPRRVDKSTVCLLVPSLAKVKEDQIGYDDEIYFALNTLLTYKELHLMQIVDPQSFFARSPPPGQAPPVQQQQARPIAGFLVRAIPWFPRSRFNWQPKYSICIEEAVRGVLTTAPPACVQACIQNLSNTALYFHVLVYLEWLTTLVAWACEPTKLDLYLRDAFLALDGFLHNKIADTDFFQHAHTTVEVLREAAVDFCKYRQRTTELYNDDHGLACLKYPLCKTVCDFRAGLNFAKGDYALAAQSLEHFVNMFDWVIACSPSKEQTGNIDLSKTLMTTLQQNFGIFVAELAVHPGTECMDTPFILEDHLQTVKRLHLPLSIFKNGWILKQLHPFIFSRCYPDGAHLQTYALKDANTPFSWIPACLWQLLAYGKNTQLLRKGVDFASIGGLYYTRLKLFAQQAFEVAPMSNFGVIQTPLIQLSFFQNLQLAEIVEQSSFANTGWISMFDAEIIDSLIAAPARKKFFVTRLPLPDYIPHTDESLILNWHPQSSTVVSTSKKSAFGTSLQRSNASRESGTVYEEQFSDKYLKTIQKQGTELSAFVRWNSPSSLAFSRLSFLLKTVSGHKQLERALNVVISIPLLQELNFAEEIMIKYFASAPLPAKSFSSTTAILVPQLPVKHYLFQLLQYLRGATTAPQAQVFQNRFGHLAEQAAIIKTLFLNLPCVVTFVEKFVPTQTKRLGSMEILVVRLDPVFTVEAAAKALAKRSPDSKIVFELLFDPAMNGLDNRAVSPFAILQCMTLPVFETVPFESISISLVNQGLATAVKNGESLSISAKAALADCAVKSLSRFS